MKVLAISRYMRPAWIAQAVRQAGLQSDPVAIDPSELQIALLAAGGALVLIDSRFAPSWEAMARARAASPQARLVLCSRNVTPDLVRAAMECGLDGVLSTRLPLEDTGQTLRRICRGERQFRFETAQPRAVVAAQAADGDFDAFWMLGSVREL